MNELALFAGAGGGLLGSILNGWKTVCAVEIDPYCRQVLLQRQLDGMLEPFPIWGDIKSFDGRSWRGSVDIVSGGFPCQDIANGSTTKTGLDGERSGLWHEMARICCEVRPRYVFVENSANLLVRGLDRVLSDLSAMGYDARWGVFSAADVGARHERERLFILADANGFMGSPGPWIELQSGETTRICADDEALSCAHTRDWLAMARIHARGNDGMGSYVDRVKALGNGQVPRVVQAAWEILSER